jgi:hypothetical protein
MKNLLLLALALYITPILADSSAAYPPNPYEFLGGKKSPMFSEANAAAIHFISIVDNQIYGGAWVEAGGLMQDIVPQQVWTAGMRVVRQGLGVVRARKVASHRHLHVLPGGTQGEFMVITYQTQFAMKPNSIETVILIMQPPLGLWKVISYTVI